MEEEQPKQPNKYIEYIKNNKYNLFFAGAIAILLFLIIALIALTINHKTPQSQTANTTNSSPSQSVSPSSVSISTSPSPLEMQITTPDPTEAATIESEAQPQITPGDVPFTYSNMHIVGTNWATADLNNPNVQAGAIIMEKVNGVWKVIAGPGTFFPPDYVQSLGIPQSVIDSLQVSNSPSPSQ